MRYKDERIQPLMEGQPEDISPARIGGADMKIGHNFELCC